ncbi:MAG: hypothetical protein IPM47_20355 [Sphingobacteriales bacterium]|nr:MAG: hypothetical protein IPM47_20355 [Sphingobacteriales bacterium]
MSMLIHIGIISSCSKHLKLREVVDDNYHFYLQNILLSQVAISDSTILPILTEIEHSLEVFEQYVNIGRKYAVNYSVIINSFCRNDSSFFAFKIIGGSFTLFNDSNFLDKRLLEKFRIIKGLDRQFLIDTRVYNNCPSIVSLFFEEASKIDTFKLEWYKNNNNDWMIDFHPYFIEIYYFNGVELKFLKREFSEIK